MIGYQKLYEVISRALEPDLNLPVDLLPCVLELLDWKDLCACDLAVLTKARRESVWLVALGNLNISEILNSTKEATSWMQSNIKNKKWKAAFKWSVLRGIPPPVILTFPKGSDDTTLSLIDEVNVKDIDLIFGLVTY